MREASVENRAAVGHQSADRERNVVFDQIVVFEVERQRFALPLSAVERVERAVAITPLPDAPPTIAGVIDVRGDLIPVIALRKQWGLPARPLALSDQLLIASGTRRRYALLIDSVIDVQHCDAAAIAPAESLAAHTDSLRGAVSLNDSIIFIHDLDQFLSLDAERDLDKALDNV